MGEVLVIGTTGVIGDAVVKNCLKQNLPVIGLSRKANSLEAKEI